MLTLHLATRAEQRWAQQTVVAHHYLHQRVHDTCSPMAYVVRHAAIEEPIGTLIVSRLESTACYDQASRLTYGSAADVASGRAQYNRWELLNLARVWLDPCVQRGGAHHVEHGASTLIRALMQRVHYDWLQHLPPVDVEQPYQLRVLVSYCDTRVHTGYIYRASRFKLARRNARGIETFAHRLPPLSAAQDEHIRRLSAINPRAIRIRASRAAVMQGVLL
jgi:hypothetical protein